MATYCAMCTEHTTILNTVSICPSCRMDFPHAHENMVLALNSLVVDVTACLNDAVKIGALMAEHLDPDNTVQSELMSRMEDLANHLMLVDMSEDGIKAALTYLNETGVALPNWGLYRDRFTPEGRMTHAKEVNAENARRVHIDNLELELLKKEEIIEQLRNDVAELTAENNTYTGDA